MSVGESITFAGIIITFLTTIVGWLYTYRTQHAILDKQIRAQHEIALLQERLVFGREQHQALIADKVTILKEMEAWLEKGRRVFLKAITLSDPDERLHPSIERIKELSILTRELSELRESAPRLYYLARIYDTKAHSAPQWNWGNPAMPEDLSQIFLSFENEVSDQVYEAEFGSEARNRPKVDDQFYGLHEAGVSALERLKQDILVQEPNMLH